MDINKRVFCPVPVIVFANFYPDKTQLSSDRWHVHNLISLESEIYTDPLPNEWPWQEPPKDFLPTIEPLPPQEPQVQEQVEAQEDI